MVVVFVADAAFANGSIVVIVVVVFCL